MNCNNLPKLTGITTYLSEISLALVWKCLHISTHLFLSSGSTSICTKNLFATSSSASSGQVVNLDTDFVIKNYQCIIILRDYKLVDLPLVKSYKTVHQRGDRRGEEEYLQ